MTEKQIRLILALKLKEYRERAHLTAKEVGNAIGKSEKTISAWEHGRGQPDADMLFALCKLFNINDMNVFYGLDTCNRENPQEESELISVYQSLNPAGRNLLITTARTFAGNPDMQKETSDTPDSDPN